MRTKENKKEKSYLIKIPVFTSEITNRANELFDGLGYAEMIKYAKKKIDKFKDSPLKISKDKRNKAQTMEIDFVEYSEINIGDVPSLLIKISAYNTNLHDGYVETDRKFSLEQNHKVGSENNYFLLYPHIIGVDSSNYKHQWLILIYEDPNKESSEIINTVKLVLKKILEIKTSNIKLPELLEELSRIKEIPELKLRFSSVSVDDNDVDIKYRTYLTSSKIRKYKEENFENVPLNETNDILLDNNYEDEYQKKEVKIINGKREFKLIREEAQSIIKETVEELFNYRLVVSENDLEKIFEQDFIISELTNVLQLYLSNNE